MVHSVHCFFFMFFLAQVPEVRELPEGGQVIGSWEDSAALEADGDVAASEPAETYY